ncbi:MAG: anthranilate phosphoribosyltransferase [Vampirovibrio sp.]|nr:anthranilate phosphoribosyltransferase [Vampirovibrio sp.]
MINTAIFTLSDWYAFLQGECPNAEAFAILEALQTDFVSAETVQLLLQVLQAQAVINPSLLRLKEDASFTLLDCCGTGGSGRASFNTSTTVAFVLASGGVPTLKFGNRAATSPSGSFDFLEGLGLPLNQLSAQAGNAVEATGLGFLFAPDVYPSLKPLAQLRRQFGKPTVFNFLGPLLNPLQPAFRVMGCSSARMMPILAEVLKNQTSLKKGMLVRSASGMDEALPNESTEGFLIENGVVQPWRLDATIHETSVMGTLDFSMANNVSWFLQLVGAEPKTTLPEDLLPLVTLNAGLGFWVAGKVSTVDDGIALATELIVSGAVHQQLQAVQRFYVGR